MYAPHPITSSHSYYSCLQKGNTTENLNYHLYNILKLEMVWKLNTILISIDKRNLNWRTNWHGINTTKPSTIFMGDAYTHELPESKYKPVKRHRSTVAVLSLRSWWLIVRELVHIGEVRGFRNLTGTSVDHQVTNQNTTEDFQHRLQKRKRNQGDDIVTIRLCHAEKKQRNLIYRNDR